MIAHLTSLNGRLKFEAEGQTVKELWKKIALVQEIFASDSECGCCKSENIRFRHRQVDDFEYYELSCGDCYARLQFGQTKKGGLLFAKRKDEDGNYLDNHGWSVYQKEGQGNQVQGRATGTDGRRGPVPAQTTDRRQREEISDDDIPF